MKQALVCLAMLVVTALVVLTCKRDATPEVAKAPSVVRQAVASKQNAAASLSDVPSQTKAQPIRGVVREYPANTELADEPIGPDASPRMLSKSGHPVTTTNRPNESPKVQSGVIKETKRPGVISHGKVTVRSASSHSTKADTSAAISIQ